mgnify:CR=1 FL=1
MKTIFKHKRTHRKKKNQQRINNKSDFKEHNRLKDHALMDYYLMGGY